LPKVPVARGQHVPYFFCHYIYIMTKAVLNPASLAPCTKSITTFNKAAENLGPRYTYNKNPFLPDPEYDQGFGTEATSPYMLMRGGKKTKKYGKKTSKKSGKKTKKGGRKTKKSGKKAKKGGKKKGSKKGSRKSNKKGGKKRTRVMRGGQGGAPYGLPQGLVNVGREIEYGIKSLYESAVGGDKPVNPDPSVQPIGRPGPSKSYVPGLVDPKEAERKAQAEVGKL